MALCLCVLEPYMNIANLIFPLRTVRGFLAFCKNCPSYICVFSLYKTSIQLLYKKFINIYIKKESVVMW